MALSSFWTAGACSIYEARNLANDWNLESTFHGQGILNPVPAIRDLQHKIRNPQRAIQKPRFSLMHLILEECQPFSRCVSFHKRRSSVRKSEKDAIGSHLIQAADNVPRKLKFHFLNFPYCMAKFHISYWSSTSSQSRLHQGILWNTDISLTRKVCTVCGLFGERSERILGRQK